MERDWRAYHPDLPEDAGAKIELAPEESHHIRRVLRLRTGDALRVFDGRGQEWSGLIEGGGPGGVEVRLVRPIDGVVEAPVEIVLFQGLCRSDRMEWVVQKATELGVRALHPVATEQADARPPTPGRLARWRRIAIEACKQSGRRVVPEIRPLDTLPEPGAGTTAILLDGGAEAAPLGDLLSRPAEGEVWIAVGPESGFTADEIRGWREKGWQTANLGPRTLRTETAGLVAATIVLHRRGDLGSVHEKLGGVGRDG